MKRHYQKMSVTSLGILPHEGLCGTSTKASVKVSGQKTKELWLDAQDESGDFIYNNTWEEAENGL